MEERTISVDQKAQVQTLVKRPRFGRNTSESDTLDDREVNEQCWFMAEDSFKMAGVRLLKVEGDVRKPPAVCPSFTLWEGVQALDGSVSAMGTYLQGDLALW